MSEETLIGRVAERVRRENYRGPERRGPEPLALSDLLKWLPLLAVAVAGFSGYKDLEATAASNKRDLQRLEREMEKDEDRERAQWAEIAKLRD